MKIYFGCQVCKREFGEVEMSEYDHGRTIKYDVKVLCGACFRKATRVFI